MDMKKLLLGLIILSIVLILGAILVGGALGISLGLLVIGPEQAGEALMFWGALLFGLVVLFVKQVPVPGIWRYVLGVGGLLIALLIYVGVL